MVSQKQRDIYLLLDNIRSTHNVGSIFRTADAVGVTKIFLSGYTPAPIDRFGRVRGDISKASLGAENTVPYEIVKDPLDCLKKLKKEKNISILALEQHERSMDYRSYSGEGDVLVVVGNEVDGVSSDILSMSDEIIEIPMHGEKESLNVSVATGIALYGLR